MNVLMLSDHFPPDKLGGVWECVKDIKKALEQCDLRVYVLSIGSKKPSDKENLIFRPFRNFILGSILNNFYAIYLIYKYKIDVIFNHQSAFPFFLILKIINPNFPKILSVYHGTFFSEFSEVKSIIIGNKKYRPSFREYVEKYFFAPVHILIDGWTYLFSDTVSAISKEIREEINNTYGKIYKQKVFYIPNGIKIPSDSYEDNKTLYLDTLNLDTIVFAGAFRVRKRVFHLIFAFIEVLKKHPETKLILVGAGRNYESKIKKIIRECNIQDNVVLTGQLTREETLMKIAEADIFCLPSSREGCPLALLDAISQKKACVTSDAIEEFFISNHEILTFEKDNFKDLSQKLVELLNDPKLRKKLGENAYEKLSQEFCIEKQTSRYLAIMNNTNMPI